MRTEGPARPASPAGAAGSVPRTAPRRGSFPPTVPRLQAGGDPRAAERPPLRSPPAPAAAAARPVPIRPHGAVPGRAAPPELGPGQRRSPRTARSLPLRCPRGGRVQSGAGTGGAGSAGLLRARVPVREQRGGPGGARLRSGLSVSGVPAPQRGPGAAEQPLPALAGAPLALCLHPLHRSRSRSSHPRRPRRALSGAAGPARSSGPAALPQGLSVTARCSARLLRSVSACSWHSPGRKRFSWENDVS